MNDELGTINRRDIPEGSSALACAGFSWDQIIKLLIETGILEKAIPEIRRRSTIWALRARQSGVRIEIYDDDEGFRRDVVSRAQSGLPIHAGHLAWW